MKKVMHLIAAVLCLTLLLSSCAGPEAPSTTDNATQGGITVNSTTAPATVPTEPEATTQPSQPTQTTAPTVPTDPAVPTDPTDPSVPTEPSVPEVDTYRVNPLEYPGDAVQTLAERNISVVDFAARGAAETSYTGNAHHVGTNIVVSPYYTATVDGVELPVYATPVYVYTNSHGVLHSYASVDVDFGNRESITLKLKVDDYVPVKSAQVYSHDSAKLTLKDRTITLEISKHGTYTVVLDDNQEYAISVFVRTYEDEQAEIDRYKAQFGDDKVIVYEPGLHEISYINMLQDNTVLYLKAGALLLPKHTFDIVSDTVNATLSEFGAQYCNELGLSRYPVINGYASDNMVIAGRGTVDMTQLDWHERRGIVFSLCNHVSMDGVIMVNPCEWSFITYRCTDVSVTQSAVLGYRTNSDAFAICNTIDATVTDCFARTGDDMFEVKTLGGVATAVSDNITFSRCQAWGSKARCFGVIGEIEKSVTNVTFQDGIVIFRDATWDNNRIGSLIVLRECGKGNVDGITFRNIHIHHDSGRPINVGVYNSDLTEGTMQNIVFQNITVNAKMKGQVRQNNCQRFFIVLKNVEANGQLITDRNVVDYIYWDAEGMISVE